MRTVIMLASVLLVGLPAVVAAHEEAKTPVSGSIILDMSKPSAPSRDRAFDQSLRESGPAPPKSLVEGEIQPDGSVKYGSTTVIIRHDCPPGADTFLPPPRPGRRR